MRAVPPERWGEFPLVPIPALRVVTGAWVTREGRPRVQPHTTRVWRAGYEIFEANADVLEARALDRLLCGGTTLARLGEVLGCEMSEEDAARESAALLLRWLDDGILHSDAVQ